MTNVLVDTAGVFRCCLDCDFPDAEVGTKIPCPHGKNAEGHGMELVERKGRRIWTAQWIADRDRGP